MGRQKNSYGIQRLTRNSFSKKQNVALFCQSLEIGFVPPPSRLATMLSMIQYRTLFFHRFGVKIERNKSLKVSVSDGYTSSIV